MRSNLRRSIPHNRFDLPLAIDTLSDLAHSLNGWNPRFPERILSKRIQVLCAVKSLTLQYQRYLRRFHATTRKHLSHASSQRFSIDIGMVVFQVKLKMGITFADVLQACTLGSIEGLGPLHRQR